VGEWMQAEGSKGGRNHNNGDWEENPVAGRLLSVYGIGIKAWRRTRAPDPAGSSAA